ncbi:unnamed protein product [Bathycoccus prasinos]
MRALSAPPPPPLVAVHAGSTTTTKTLLADLPQLVKATPAKFLKTYETKAYFTSQSRCENFDPASHSCFWVSSLGAAPLLGWYSVLLNQPFVNGMPVVLEYARVHRDEWLNEE